jgi:predicted NBD/HSP70 family sugar kinase
MLFLGLGTGLGSALVADGTIVPMELAHFPAWKGTHEDYLGLRGLERLGKRKWRQYVATAVARLQAALILDDVVIGGGNAKELKEPPPGCRIGNNFNAFLGGFRLWEDPKPRRSGRPVQSPARKH